MLSAYEPRPAVGALVMLGGDAPRAAGAARMLSLAQASPRPLLVAADRGAAEALNVQEGTPLLSVERVTYTYGDKPVEWRRGLYSTAEHFYLNELN